MDKDAAIARAKKLVGDLAQQISDEHWEYAAEDAHTIDPAGKIPGQDGYTPTYDPHWLAAAAVEGLAVRTLGQGGLLSFTSEGATFAFKAPDLFGAAAMLRAKSPLSRLAARLDGVIEVDGRMSDYIPTSARNGGVTRLPNGQLIPRRLDWI